MKKRKKKKRKKMMKTVANYEKVIKDLNNKLNKTIT